MKPLLHLFLAAFFFAIPARADLAKFTGDWQIDYDRTLQEAKKSPKYKPEEEGPMAEKMKQIMAAMKLRVSDKEVAFFKGTRQQAVPFTLQSSDDSSAVLSGNANGKEFTLTLKLVEGKFLYVQSSATDDMSYFIWKRSAPDR